MIKTALLTRLRRALTVAPLTAAPLMLAACTVGPDFERPAPPPPAAGYGATGGARATLGEGPAGEWWKAFQSPGLDALVEQALTHNHSLAASRETLVRAVERVAAVRGRTLPQADLDGRAEYQKFNFQAIGLGNSGIGNPKFDLYTVGGGVSYDLDLFGANRRALEQAGAETRAQARATEAAHLLVAGRVVSQVLAIAALNDKLATQRRLLEEDERNVRLTEARRQAGDGTLVEVLTAQNQLAADRADLPMIEQSLADARSILAVLLGVSPAELGPTNFTLADFALPESVPVALPSELVHKRPDILEAEARLHAAVAEVGMATAALYPNLTIGATVTQSTSQPDRITSSRFNAYDIFAAVTAPIFRGGTLSAQKRGAQAAARAAAAEYQQVVTEAFGQVATLLSALETDGRELAERRAATDIAERGLQLSRRSFQVGNSGVLQVLEANRFSQRAQLALLDTRARQYQNVTRLLVATAGGWSPDAEDLAAFETQQAKAAVAHRR